MYISKLIPSAFQQGKCVKSDKIKSGINIKRATTVTICDFLKRVAIFVNGIF